MSHLPDELLLYIANQLLNPAERSRLATCNRRLKGLLPTPLRIKVVNSRGDGSLQPEFFVSHADKRIDDSTNFLLSHESLYFGEQYLLWTFDYQRGNKVYLGRHTRHGHKATAHGELQYIFTLGLRPRSPNQIWEVIGGDSGDLVMWGEDIGMSVKGMNPNPTQPDGNQRGLVSCLPASSAAIALAGDRLDTPNNWCVLGDEWGTSEKLQLLPCSMYVPGDDVREQPLNVHAIPEVCDKGEYLLHSPSSQKDGEITCEGYHVTVDFHFWIHQGIMHFHALSLPFALGIPILETDTRHSGSSPLADLLEIRSARWGCVIYYMAVAADVGEGKALDMERFNRRVADHRDHAVRYLPEKQMVYIDVRNNAVRSDSPSLARDTNAAWKFILSW